MHSSQLGTPLIPGITSDTVLEFGQYYAEQERAYASGIAEKPWYTYGSTGITAYNIFKDIEVLSPGSVVIELFSVGCILRIIPGYKLGKGIAVSLGDGRTQSQKQYDSLANISLVEANLITEEGWHSLTCAMENRQANLLICDPKGGWSTVPNNINLHLLLLQKMIGLLSSPGTLVINLSTSLFIDGRNSLYDFLECLKQQGYIIDDMIILGGLLRVRRI